MPKARCYSLAWCAHSKQNLRNAVDELPTLKSSGSKNLSSSVDLTAKELNFLKAAMRHQLRTVRKIPSLARAQLLVTLTANFEGYVADVIRMIFKTNSNTLKPGEKTLKDEELIEALESGAALNALIEKKVRNIMYGSTTKWNAFLRNHLQLKFDETFAVEELFLVRNCVLHNDGNVSKELWAKKRTRYKSPGRPINITEARYRSIYGCYERRCRCYLE